MVIKTLVGKGAVLPSYRTRGAAGADVSAASDCPVAIAPGEWKLIPTGLSVEIPEGYEIQVRPRSGLAAKYGVTVLNAPGTIDSDYRGEISVILINHGSQDFIVNPGDRIAQLVVSRVERAEFTCTGGISRTERGDGGFGSTGV